jgi:hypothetical protein
MSLELPLTVYHTPAKSGWRVQSSVSPHSLSTEDNSFEKEHSICRVREDPDGLLESLLGYFGNTLPFDHYRSLGTHTLHFRNIYLQSRIG